MRLERRPFRKLSHTHVDGMLRAECFRRREDGKRPSTKGCLSPSGTAHSVSSLTMTITFEFVPGCHFHLHIAHLWK